MDNMKLNEAQADVLGKYISRVVMTEKFLNSFARAIKELSCYELRAYIEIVVTLHLWLSSKQAFKEGFTTEQLNEVMKFFMLHINSLETYSSTNYENLYESYVNGAINFLEKETN